LARKPVVLIIGLAGQAPSRRSPLSSNVRRHTDEQASAPGRIVLTKYVLSGQFTTGFRRDLKGQLDTYLGEHELIVGPVQQGI